MKTLSVSAMRELDERTIAAGVSGHTLMDRAGRAVAEAVLRMVDVSRCAPDILLIAGRGNNGGDVFAAARHLARRGIGVEVRLAGRADDLRGEARAHYQQMTTSSICCLEAPDPSDWERMNPLDTSCGVVVDGLLGTGFTGPARGVMASAIAFINRVAARAFVLAVDLPSGLNGDTGVRAGGAIVRADATVSLGRPKSCFFDADAQAFLGSVEVADIGLLDDGAGDAREVITARDVEARLGRRRFDAHKGSFGHVLLAGGSRGLSGAIALAGRAALRSGCGLATVLTPECVQPTVAGHAAELMVKACAQTPEGALAGDVWEAWCAQAPSRFTAYLLGPGMTATDETRRMVDSFLRHATVPVVLDADAISVFAGGPEALRDRRAPLVLTPHPGELARLLGVDTEAIRKDRPGAVAQAAARTGAVVVLKGAGTLVMGAQDTLWLNLTGNPGMATGGTGDVLAGLTAGFLAAGLAPFDAALCAVFLHGRAGDYAAWALTQRGLLAGDVVDYLPRALQSIQPR